MQIKIEGLPEGHIIKHINVDITFDENGGVMQKMKINEAPVAYHPLNDLDGAEPMVHEKAAQLAGDAVWNDEETTDKNVFAPNIPDSFKTRVTKDIPPEMKDMEF